VQEQLQSLGENLITINAGSVNQGGVHWEATLRNRWCPRTQQPFRNRSRP
jgi:hypothetical protein